MRGRGWAGLAVLLALAALPWLLVERGDRDALPPPETPADDTDRGPPPTLRGAAAPRGGERPPSEATPPAPVDDPDRANDAAAPYTIRGRVVMEYPDDAALPRGTLRLTSFVRSDWRNLERPPEFDATVDGAGRFEVEIPTSPQTFVRSIEWDGPSVRVTRWHLETEPSRQVLEVGPGAENRIVVHLAACFRLSGVVVGHDREPLAGATVSWSMPQWSADNSGAPHVRLSRERRTTEDDGRFDVGPFLTWPPEKSLGIPRALSLHFERKGHETVRLDPWSVPASKRDDLVVVLDAGVGLAGTLHDDRGRALPGVLVELTYGEDWRLRRAARTDERGLWRLEHLTRGQATLRANAYAHGAFLERAIEVAEDDDRVDLVAKTLPEPDASRVHRVMGLTLVELDENLREAYGLPPQVHVMIHAAGEEHAALGIGTLEPGYGIWQIGNEDVGSVRQLVAQILALSDPAEGRHPLGARVRVVYTFANERMRGTNTQHMHVSPEDRAALRALLARLRDR